MKFIRFDSDSELYDKEIVLRNRVLRKPLGMKLTTAFLRKDKGDSHYSVIDDDNRMVACLLIKHLTPDRVKLRQMAVEESERGKGIGAFLIRETEKELRKDGISTVELHARKYAEKFYLKSGYSPVGNEFYEIGIPHIKMVKKLL